MNTRLDGMRGIVLGVDGLVCRWPGGLMLFVGGPKQLEQLLSGDRSSDPEQLLAVARSIDWAKGGGGYAALLQKGAAVEAEASGMCDLLVGESRVTTDQVTYTRIDPLPHVLGLIDRRAATPEVGGPVQDALRLVHGLVPGAGCLLIAESEHRSRPQHDAGPATGTLPPIEPESPFELFNINESPAEMPPPLPVPDLEDVEDVAGADAPDDDKVMVDGICCSRDHFNHPEAQYCLVCGISMVNRTKNLVSGPRPTLGYLVMDDGKSYHLAQNYVFGREPKKFDEAESVVLAGGDVSRVHAKVELVGWDVMVEDLSSTNGTRWQGPQADGWKELKPGEPHRLEPGSHVELGQDRHFTFEAVHKLRGI